MSEMRPTGQEPKAEEESRLKRPDDEIKDLDAPPEKSEDVRGGLNFSKIDDGDIK